MLRIALCTFGKREEEYEEENQGTREREKTTVTLTANATPLPNRKPPRCRIEGNISKVPFLINRIEIKI